MERHLVAKLVALNERTRQAWAHPHNRSYYRPASFQGFSVRDGKSREPTPSEADMSTYNHMPDTEPEIHLYLDDRPKYRSKGWVFGSDRNACDIYCGEADKSGKYNIGRQTFSITINKQSNVVLNHLRNTNRTQVQYDDQQAGDRRDFVWIMLPYCEKIYVTTANELKFRVLVVDPSKLRESRRISRSIYLSWFLGDVEDTMPSNPLRSIESGSTASDSSLCYTPKPRPFYYVRKDRLLGKGSFGKVYIVVDVSSGVEYAGKPFIGDVDQREADILAKQNHVNILRYVTLSDDAKPLMVTEYVKEGNLSRPWLVKDQGPWQVDQIVRILTQALRGLASLHAGPNPVVHRDIKPTNILVADHDRGGDPNEYGPWIKLADFGLATEGSKCEGKAGTWLYTAPEVFRPVRYTSKVDIWSLGVVILQLLLEGNVPVASGDHMEGEVWCKDIFNFTRRNTDAYLRKDRQELSENEYSLRSFLWVFIRNFMLQGDPNKRLSAQECLRDRLFLEMQFASKYIGGWQVERQFEYKRLNITKKFPPKARAPLPNTGPGAVTKASYNPGVKVSVALEAQASKRSRTARPKSPKPVGFGLVFGDPDATISG